MTWVNANPRVTMTTCSVERVSISCTAAYIRSAKSLLVSAPGIPSSCDIRSPTAGGGMNRSSSQLCGLLQLCRRTFPATVNRVLRFCRALMRWVGRALSPKEIGREHLDVEAGATTETGIRLRHGTCSTSSSVSSTTACNTGRPSTRGKHSRYRCAAARLSSTSLRERSWEGLHVPRPVDERRVDEAAGDVVAVQLLSGLGGNGDQKCAGGLCGGDSR
jgi:hypothetical protein